MSEQPPQYPGSGWVPPGAGPQPPQQPQAPQQPLPPLPPGYGPPLPPVQYYPPGQGPEKPPSRTMAVIALVLAIVPCGITWLAAIVLGIIVLVKARTGQVAGRGLAVAALVISVLWLVAAGVATVFIVQEVTKYDDNRDAGEGTVRSSMLRQGDCLAELPKGEEVTTVEIIPCEKVHAAEVYAVFSLDIGDNPSQSEIYDAAEDRCRERLEDFLGSAGPDDLEYSLIAPDDDAVELDDDVACYAYVPGETSTGSLAD